jgi:hypothetical protein
MVRRIEFDANAEELTSAHLVHFKSTKAWRRSRRYNIAAAWAAGGLAALVFMWSKIGERTVPMVAVVTVTSVVIGGFAALMFARLYESSARKYFARHLREAFGETPNFHCEIELRPAGAWGRQNGIELLLPWPDALAVEDLDEGVYMRFRGGFILARRQAFGDAGERQAFLDDARRLAGLQRPPTTSGRDGA